MSDMHFDYKRNRKLRNTRQIYTGEIVKKKSVLHTKDLIKIIAKRKKCIRKSRGKAEINHYKGEFGICIACQLIKIRDKRNLKTKSKLVERIHIIIHPLYKYLIRCQGGHVCSLSFLMRNCGLTKCLRDCGRE